MPLSFLTPFNYPDDSDEEPMKEQILEAAIFIASRQGFQALTRIAVAKRADVAEGTVSYHFKTMSRLHDAVVRCAIEYGNTPILARALADGHRLAKAAPLHLKEEAAKLITA